MLKITIPEREIYDESQNLFIQIKEQTIQFEHSLLSLSKWESKWCKPFLSKDKHTVEETMDYIKCMTTTQNVNPEVYSYLTEENVKEIIEYIEAPMTATWFSKNQEPTTPNREIITAELIYYWMIAFNIPFECQKWHLNRLLTLIKVCSIKNTPPKKMSKKDMINHRKSLNNARKASLHTHG